MGSTTILGQAVPIVIIVVTASMVVALAATRPCRRGRPDQVAAVSHQAVSWRWRTVLNHNESLVHESAQAVLNQPNPSWEAWPQVSLGEVVETQGRTDMNREAYCWINSKRADFLVDGTGWPLAVIGYQGRGHYRGNAAERDAVRRTVLSRAGVRYMAQSPHRLKVANLLLLNKPSSEQHNGPNYEQRLTC